MLANLRKYAIMSKIPKGIKATKNVQTLKEEGKQHETRKNN